jgi:hypothetical protein
LSGHARIPLWKVRENGEGLSKRFDAHSTPGRVSRHPDATTPNPHRHPKGRKRPVQTFTPPRNVGIGSCAPPGVHLTSQQHRSASTLVDSRRCRPRRVRSPPRSASAQPVPLRHRSRRPHRRVSCCAP